MSLFGGCHQRAKSGQEKPPHVRGQGQKPGGPHARRAAAKKSYPTSEVRGSGRGYQTATGQERPRGATPGLRSGAAGAGGLPRGDTQRLRPGAAARRSYPTPEARGGGQEDQPHVQGAVAAWAQEGLEELSHIEGQEGRR